LDGCSDHLAIPADAALHRHVAAAIAGAVAVRYEPGR
jgi:hypothetical protein